MTPPSRSPEDRPDWPPHPPQHVASSARWSDGSPVVPPPIHGGAHPFLVPASTPAAPRRRRRWPWVVLALLAVAALLATCAGRAATITPTSPGDAPASTGSDPSASDAGYNDLPLGRGVTVNASRMTADGSDQPYTLQLTLESVKTTRRGFPYGDRPKHVYVGLLAVYDCRRGTCAYNPLDWTIRDRSGNESNMTLGGFEPALASGDLRAGRKARGYVTYDLPPGRYTAEYSTGLSDHRASWTFTVR